MADSLVVLNNKKPIRIFFPYNNPNRNPKEIGRKKIFLVKEKCKEWNK